MAHDDRTLRVVILPDVPSAGPLIDLLRALLAQRLIDPPILLVDGSMVTRRLGVTADDDEIKPLRHHIETAQCERFLLINLVTADATPPRSEPETALSDPARSDESDESDESGVVVAAELRTAFEVDTFIRNALAFKFEADAENVPQRLDVVNLVVPPARANSMPAYLHSRGPEVGANVSGWSNVVVAPEIQATSLQAVVPVACDEEYVAHVGAALITVAGCWAGATWDPEFPSWEPDRWTVVRGRSRSLVAPELPVRVLQRIGGSANQIPVADEVEYLLAPNPRHAVDLALHQIVKRHDLNLRSFIRVEETSSQQIIRIMDFVRMLWAWVTGTLPSIVKAEVRERIQSMGDRVDDRINQRAGLDGQSRYRIRFLGRKHRPPSAAPHAETHPFDRQNWRFVAAEPAVWPSLRDLSFGLLDGGDVRDDAVRGLLGGGSQRYVLGDQRLISPPPDVPLWKPSDPIAALGISPGPVRSVVDVEWAAGWAEALDGLIAELKAGGSAEQEGNVEGHITGPSAEQLLILAERDLDRLQTARAIAKQSFLWGLGEHLYGEYQKVRLFLAGLREQKREAEKEAADLGSIEKGGRAAKHGALARLLITLAVLIVLAVGVYFGIEVPLALGIAVRSRVGRIGFRRAGESRSIAVAVRSLVVLGRAPHALAPSRSHRRPRPGDPL